MENEEGKSLANQGIWYASGTYSSNYEILSSWSKVVMDRFVSKVVFATKYLNTSLHRGLVSNCDFLIDPHVKKYT